MKFDFDINKNHKNHDKHGISFEDAQALWNDNNGLIVPVNIIDGEIRYALISHLNDKCYVAIFTLRNEKYRIISVRRCRKNEEKNYENNLSARIG